MFAVSVEETAQTACPKLSTAFEVPEVGGRCLQLLDASKLFKALRNSSGTLEVVRSRLKRFKAPRGCSKLFEDVKVFGAGVICPKLVEVV